MIERDVPVPAGDGVVLRADVFRPEGPGRYPVILSYGPYAKGLAFQEGYADQWRLMTAGTPMLHAGRATSTRTGRSPTRRSGCRTATAASGWTHAERAARQAGLTPSRHGKPGTCTSASNGRRRSRGVPARWALTESPTMR